jgi:heme-degrading monooxygenase HmoA
MILVANRIFVAPEHAGEFESLLETRAGLVDHMPGFAAIHLLRPTRADQPYVILTQWQSRPHFEAWTRTDEFTRGHARVAALPTGMFTHPTHLEIHEVLHASTRAEAAPRDAGEA